MVIAILGASGQIGKTLMHYFNKGLHEVFAFSRNEKYWSYDKFFENKYDAIINCVGHGSYTEDYKYIDIFNTIEYYDNLIIQYLMSNIDCKYINFTTGAVYKKTDINNIKEDDYLTIAKRYQEAKHRAYKDLNIHDVRLYSYFSRWANLDQKYFMNKLVKCLINNDTFKYTESIHQLTRDYIHPKDLFNFVAFLAECSGNQVYEIGSKKPIDLFKILNVYKRKGLQIESSQDDFENLSGSKFIYIPRRKDNKPQATSLDTIFQEVKYFETD